MLHDRTGLYHDVAPRRRLALQSEPDMAAHGKIARREEIAREKEREREREREGPQALTGKGKRGGGMGAGSCPQERFFGAFMC